MLNCYFSGVKEVISFHLRHQGGGRGSLRAVPPTSTGELQRSAPIRSKLPHLYPWRQSGHQWRFYKTGCPDASVVPVLWPQRSQLSGFHQRGHWGRPVSKYLRHPSRISSSKIKTQIIKMLAHCFNSQLACHHTIY